jgi:hypothetical protein
MQVSHIFFHDISIVLAIRAQEPQKCVQDPQAVRRTPMWCKILRCVCRAPKERAGSQGVRRTTTWCKIPKVCGRIPKLCAGSPGCVHDPQGVFRIPKVCARTPRCEQDP